MKLGPDLGCTIKRSTDSNRSNVVRMLTHVCCGEEALCCVQMLKLAAIRRTICVTTYTIAPGYSPGVTSCDCCRWLLATWMDSDIATSETNGAGSYVPDCFQVGAVLVI